MKLNLLSTDSKPTILLLDLPALIDTGAELSVCNLTPAIFEQLFFNNFKDKRLGSINGFGGEAKGIEYTVLSLKIGTLNLTDVKFVVPDNPTTRYKFILAGTLFSEYPYRIDMINRELTIECD